MPYAPGAIWPALSPVLQAAIHAELAAIFQEIIDVQHRRHHPPASARTAVISIRQSTPHQALSHQESLRLQYALTERAQALG
jgi:hypothetical protein